MRYWKSVQACRNLCATAVLFFILQAGTVVGAEGISAVSRDPEGNGSRLSAGLKVGANMARMGESGSGYGYSPVVSGLLGYDFFKYGGAVVEMGYGQSRFPLEEGEIRADYLKTGLYALLGLNRNRGLVPYLLAGACLKKVLTSNYTDDYDGTEYEFKDYYSEYIWGLVAGAGLRFMFSSITWFVEVLGTRSMGNTVHDVESNVMVMGRSPEMELQASAGVLFHFQKRNAVGAPKLLPDKTDGKLINKKKGAANEK